MTKEQMMKKLEESLKKAGDLYEHMSEQQSKMRDVILMIMDAMSKLK